VIFFAEKQIPESVTKEAKINIKYLNFKIVSFFGVFLERGFNQEFF
jgi:hypothetical protein